jgi:hypothetical protein
MPPKQYIINGITITEFDFTTSDALQIERYTKDYRDFVVLQPKQSLRVLSNLTGSPINSRSVDALKAFALHNKPYVVASAVVGLSMARKTLVTVINYFAKRDIRLFDTVEHAQEWLAQQK